MNGWLKISRACLGFAALGAWAAVGAWALPSQAQPVRQTEEETDGLRYLLHVPNDHDPAKKWPVLVFLHGSGESGTVLTDLMSHSIPLVVEDAEWDWPFITVSPQSEGGGWDSDVASLTAVLARMATEFGGDTNRYYLTGLSYGGSGTWNLGVLMDGVWAALMPLCAGGANSFQTAPFVDTPLFVVHGDADPDNDYADDRDRVDQLIAAGINFYEFDYPQSDQGLDNFPLEVLNNTHVFATMVGYGHDVWDATYGVKDMRPMKTVPYRWLLQQSLDGSPFVDPADQNAGGAGGAAGAAGSAGDSGAGGAAAGAGGAGGAPAGGAGGLAGGGGGGGNTAGSPAGAAGAVAAAGATAGSPPVAAAGAGGSGGGVAAPTTMANDSETAAGCGCTMHERSGRAVGLGLILVGLLWVTRRFGR